MFLFNNQPVFPDRKEKQSRRHIIICRWCDYISKQFKIKRETTGTIKKIFKVPQLQNKCAKLIGFPYASNNWYEFIFENLTMGNFKKKACIGEKRFYLFATEEFI